MSEEPRGAAAQKYDRFMRIFNLWLFGDVIFAILPLLVLAAITGLLGELFAGFLDLKEWSFATIVLFGVAIRKFIRLKVEIQQTPTHYKLDVGVQLLIVLLIASVLVLSLVILAEKGVLSESKVGLLGKAQLYLFVIAAAGVAAAVAGEDKDVRWARARGKDISRLWLLERVRFELGKAEEALQYVLVAMDRVASGPVAASPAALGEQREEEWQSGAIIALLDRFDGLVADIRKGLTSATPGARVGSGITMG